MNGRWLKLALGVFAIASGPLALVGFNRGMGKGGFASSVGGEKWFAPRPGFFETVGVADPELSPLGSVFNWTQNEAVIRFERLERSRPALVTLRIMRPLGEGPAPEVIFSVDGVEAQRLRAPSGPRRVSLDLPRHAGRGAVVSIKVMDPVGVMLENVRLAGERGPLPIPLEAMGALAFLSLGAYAAVLLSGASAWVALSITLLAATGFGWLSITGGAFLGRYSERIAWIVAAFLVLALATLRVRELRWRRAWILILGLAALKLAVLSHPRINDADAAFHAGNLRRVISGDWYFTSATPPPAISFPYPPGLSFTAFPLWRLPQRNWVTGLRSIVIVSEMVSAAVFSLAIASLSSEAVGVLTFLFLALSPEGCAVLFIGNLSNLFAEALLLLGCSFLITQRSALSSVSLLGAFLSHFGTLLLGGPLSFLLALSQGDLLARVARRVAPVVVALVSAFALYYWRFLRVVTDAWERMTYLKGAAAVGPMTAPVEDKLVRMSGGSDWWMTAVLLVATAIGMATWPRDRRPLARILFLWLLVVVGFALLGLVTPVQVRTALSARPALAVLCASATCALWTRGGVWKALSCGLVLFTAVACWMTAISFFPVRG